jgi:hypothetical protein
MSPHITPRQETTVNIASQGLDLLLFGIVEVFYFFQGHRSCRNEQAARIMNSDKHSILVKT